MYNQNPVFLEKNKERQCTFSTHTTLSQKLPSKYKTKSDGRDALMGAVKVKHLPAD